MSLQLKTAEQRKAEIRAESDAREAKQAAEKALKEVENLSSTVPPGEEMLDIKALAAQEELNAAKVKAITEKMQELDPSLKKVEEPLITRDSLFAKHDNPQEALEALHAHIRRLREDSIPKPEKTYSNLDHLSPSQRERTLREMEGGRARSAIAEAEAEKYKALRDNLEAQENQRKVDIEKLKAELEELKRTVIVLRHNPENGKEVFPTVPANKVAMSGTA